MLLTRAKLELVTAKEATAISAIDADAVSSKTKQYISSNALGYYVILNTWLMIIKQYSAHGWISVLRRISKVGLLEVIKEASSAADALVHGDQVDSGMFSSIIRDVYTVVGKTVFTPSNEEKTINNDPMASALCLLRYPKRFSPLYNDLVEKKSINDFLAVENRSKLIMRRGYSRYYINEMRYEMQKMISWDRCCSDIEKAINDPADVNFTSGSALDSNSSLGSKLVAVSKTNPEYFIHPFGYEYTGAWNQTERTYWGLNEEVRPVEVRAVPKSYKASRIIAMEQTYRQGKANVIEKIIDAYLPFEINIHDQTRNQLLAMYGSQHNGEHAIATIDLSNASDTITKVLFWEIFPKRFCDLVYPFLGTHTVIDGNVRLMQQMSTAGNSLTFILESMVFLALDRVAQSLYTRFSGEKLPATVAIGKKHYPVPSVFGDDQVVYSCTYDTLLSVAEALGFIINDSKSYTDGKYRESCGLEFWEGVDVSSYYFPRFPLEGTLSNTVQIASKIRRDSFKDVYIDTLTSLVSLQHRLFLFCQEASLFLRELILEACPKMTTSIQGTRLDDVWDYEDTSVARWAPYAEVVAPINKWSRATLRRIKEPRAERSAKFLPAVRFVLDKDVTPYQARLLDAYNYYHFLRFGPRYEDPLLKSLGISAPPVTKEQAFGKPQIIWSLREVDYK